MISINPHLPIYQNISAYIEGGAERITIEFRAECYEESFSEFLIVLNNEEHEIECIPQIDWGYEKTFIQKKALSDGRMFNAVKIVHHGKISPNFPFKVEISAKGNAPIRFKGILQNDFPNTVFGIPGHKAVHFFSFIPFKTCLGNH